MRSRREIDAPEIQIAPMIDCVFLMLVYFMTTSSLDKSEADLQFPAGGVGQMSDPLPAVDEQTLTFEGIGELNWNGSLFNLKNMADTDALTERLLAFKRGCFRARTEPSLRLIPAANTSHQIIVKLLDSISASGIDKIHFP